MKIQGFLHAEDSSLTGLDRMVGLEAFYTAVDGGSIRKSLINVDDLTQTTDDVSLCSNSYP
jgi:hypothetical protein